MLKVGITCGIASFLRDKQYRGKIYLYTALYNEAAFDRIMNLVDGLTYTLHADATDNDVYALKSLSTRLAFNLKTVVCCSCRLSIDTRLYEKYDFSNIDFSGWDVIRRMQWKEECPIPEGEELFVLGGTYGGGYNEGTN